MSPLLDVFGEVGDPCEVNCGSELEIEVAGEFIAASQLPQ
jgi:hypothetical protein